MFQPFLESLINYPKGTLLLAVSLVNLCWLLYVIKKGLLPRLIKAYTAYACFVFLWIITNAYFQSELLVQLPKDWAVWMALISNISGCFVTLSLFYLSCLIRDPKSLRSFKVWSFIAGIGITNLVINVLPGMTVYDVQIKDVGIFTLQQGPLSNLFFIITAISIIPTIYNFVKSVQKSRKVEHLRNLYILVGTIIMYVSALSGNMFLPMLAARYDTAWVAPSLSIAEVLIVGYALVVSRFIDIRLATYRTTSLLNAIAVYGVLVWSILQIESLYALNPRITALLLFGVWILLLTTWREVETTSSWMWSKVFYPRKINPLRAIQSTLEAFKDSLQKGIQTLGNALNTSGAQFIFVGESSSPETQLLQKFFQKNPEKSLIQDELQYQLEQRIPTRRTKILKKTLEKMMVAAAIPVLDDNKKLLGILLLEQKLDGKLFSTQEIKATKSLLKKATIYIGKERDYAAILTKLQHKEGVDGEFLDDLMHEIRHPLMMARNMTEIIDWSRLLPEDQKFLKNTESSLTDMSKKLDRITEAAHAKNKSVVLQKSWNQLPEFIQHLEEKVQLLFSKKKHHLKTSFKTKLKNPLFHFDTAQLQQALLEIIKNGFQFNTQQKPTVRLTINASKTELIFTITDNGRGIKKNNQSKIFDLLWNSSASRSPHEGIGVGLTYARGIIQTHKGTIKIIKSTAQGTTFQVVIPCKTRTT